MGVKYRTFHLTLMQITLFTILRFNDFLLLISFVIKGMIALFQYDFTSKP
jgi:hypothetical protein